MRALGFELWGGGCKALRLGWLRGVGISVEGSIDGF